MNNQLKNIPAKPGIYKFKDAKRKLLYIGKAKNLKSRVRSYFSNEGPMVELGKKTGSPYHLGRYLNQEVIGSNPAGSTI